MSYSILVVEDEPVLRQSLAELLSGEGYQVETRGDGQSALDCLLERGFDAIITDVRMPEMDGHTLLGHAQRIAPQTPVIVITAYGTVQSAVAMMRAGACDYLLKPVNFDDLLLKLERALQHRELLTTRQVLTEQLAAESTFHDLVGESPPMTRLFDTVRKLSTVKSTVLLMGESGTGKELFARAIHYNGITRDKPFVAVNCGAIPESLIESELFGHRRGSFTGAIRDKTGYFVAANHGTLFLDEISTLPMPMQSALLRALEQRAVVPVGDTRAQPVDLRIVAASNRNLDQMVEQGTFREDLLYRLAVVRLELPPLRRRRSDIPGLVYHFLGKYTRQMNKHVLGVSNAAMRAMLAHEWRGNVRELENAIERAVIFAEDRTIEIEDLPFASSCGELDDDENLKDALRQFERQHILDCLKRHHYDKAAVAARLGIGTSSLYRKLDELDIPKTPPEKPAPAPEAH